MRTLEAPTVDRLEFAQLCQGIGEFEPLPDHTRAGLVDEEYEPDLEEPTALDKLILAGLVSPV
jgi:hypothetical protein